MGQNNTVSLYLSCILAAYAIIGLVVISSVSNLLGALTIILLTIAVIVVVIFALAIIITGLIKLFSSFKG
ncbi:hypothetical protein KHA93_05320 [Bacillus sp. FJAT-49732]|uniref:Uncharacterized protein n=1 Tax=Lederbergia citrisecunda TaxID=2833583 RepID=A0A942TJ43_9BACI|nr:hypothetical protein [Lederbergia citrisecunda]MBS4199076.1 hypothetical protein [Lederbergia citrisecunda]